MILVTIINMLIDYVNIIDVILCLSSMWNTLM